MKRILIPTDFSGNATNALEFALSLFQNEECTFYLLNTFDVKFTTTNMMVPEPGNPAYDMALDESLSKIEKVIEKAGSLKNDKHSFQGFSKINFLIEAVSTMVEDHGIDMIVMGTRGTQSTSKLGIGSNTLTVMERITNCPVLAIPEEAKFHGFKEILFPTSYEVTYKSRELKPFMAFVKDFNASVRILHIRDEENLTSTQEENKARLEEDFKGLDYSFHSLSNMDPVMGINCFTQSRDTDLIALVSRQHSFYYKLTKQNVLKQINHFLKIPLLVMHHN